MIIGLIQFDLSKAFDLVNRSLVLHKLDVYKCNHSAIKCFISYLAAKVSVQNGICTI